MRTKRLDRPARQTASTPPPLQTPACKEAVGQEAGPAQTPSLLAETFLLVTAASFGPGEMRPRTPALSSAIQRYPALSAPALPEQVVVVVTSHPPPPTEPTQSEM